MVLVRLVPRLTDLTTLLGGTVVFLVVVAVGVRVGVDFTGPRISPMRCLSAFSVQSEMKVRVVRSGYDEND